MKSPTHLPVIVPLFDGFYNSHSSDLIDQYQEAMEMTLDEGSENFPLQMVAVANGFVKAINQKLNLNLKFMRIISPREYNFETDKIEARISIEEMVKVWEEVKKHPSIFADALKEYFTPRSGFIPYYSTDIDDWLDQDVKSMNEVELQTILYAKCLIEDVDFEELTDTSCYYEALY